MAARLGIGMVGYAFMGRAHSQAWRNVAAAFDVPLRPELAAICGRDPGGVARAADRLGWAASETDWRQLIERDDVDLVDICTPGASHAEIAIAALDAGKHVLCEKPLGNSVAEAEAMAAAARRAAPGALAMVGFNYRRVPAIALAASMIADGALGAIRHVRASYLQDWLSDPDAPASWRLQRQTAGSGALGDLGSHAVDLVLHLTGLDLTEVVAVTETFVAERPLPAAGGSGLSATAAGGSVAVDVDDAFCALGRLAGGATVTLEATRVATGRKNALRLEINGTKASLAFDLERLNELVIDEGDAAARRLLVTEPDQPYVEGWWPPGHVLGWDHTFVHEARDLLTAIAAGVQPRPSFDDGLRVQRVLSAVADSAASGSWQKV